MIAGLTGGMGSGKSTVAKLFEVMGCAVFNSDAAARSAYHSKEVRKKIEELLGQEAYLGEKEINRQYISGKVFADKDLLEKVNGVIHPAVGEMFWDFVRHNPGKIVIKESALLFEANVTSGLDKIIVVSAPDDVRIKRVMERDGAERSAVEARMRTQLPQEEKEKKADFVILNDESELIIPQVNRIFTLLRAHDQEGLSRKTV
jgi:dephospho-CoA kinase